MDEQRGLSRFAPSTGEHCAVLSQRPTLPAHDLVFDMLLDMSEFTIGAQSMTTLRFRLGHLWILCLVLSFLYGTSVTGAQPDKEVDRLAKAYRAARTEVERRALCIDAIDAGVVARDRSVAVVDAVFGTTYARKLPRGSKLETGVVDFHPPLPSGSDAVASAHTGWYLAFEFDSTGRLQNYYLSNLHK